MILFRSARPQPLPPEALIEAVEALHREVDDAAGRVASAHGERLNCQRGCHQCCVDDLTVFEVEAEVIRARAGEVLTQIPHPPGACALLDEGGACRIYDHRPYVCRTQGLPLRWIEGDEDGDEDGGAVTAA